MNGVQEFRGNDTVGWEIFAKIEILLCKLCIVQYQYPVVLAKMICSWKMFAYNQNRASFHCF
jgi:hypothetical protein